MEIKNYRSSVSYSLVSYKVDGAVEAEINYRIVKTDHKIIMSWIEFIGDSAKIGDIRIQKTPTPLLENGVLTYNIAYAEHKYTIMVSFLDNKILEDVDKVEFVEQLTADLFEKSIRSLAEDAFHLLEQEQLRVDDIIMSIKRL